MNTPPASPSSPSPSPSPTRFHPRPSRPFPLRTALLLAAVGSSTGALAQSQSLTFTGGVLLNSKVNFRQLGAHTSPALPGPSTGGAVDRTYDDGFNRLDALGNPDNTTTYWGYQSDSQLGPDGLRLRQGGAAGNLGYDDVGDFVTPSANLEYRGSLGTAGSGDWGILLSIGYQPIDADTRANVSTDATLLEDRFNLAGNLPGDLPAAPYSGLFESETGPRIGTVPARTVSTVPGGRLLSGSWELSTDIIPVTGGLYFESQIAGRLNAVASAGILAAFVSGDFKYRETSTIAGDLPLTTSGDDSKSDVLLGGFVQLGLDWALWEKVSLVTSARWQPTQSFSQTVDGREAEIEFSTAFAVHAGFSVRF